MKYGIVFTIGISFAWAVYAGTTDEYTLVPEIRTQDGTAVTVVASKMRIEATPTWDGVGDPPLAVSKAVTLAADFLSKKHHDRKDFRPLSISM